MPARTRTLASVPAPAPGKMAEKVRETVDKLDLQPEDVGIVAVAMEYAAAIDRAAAIAAAAAKIPFDPDTAEEVKKLRARVSQQVTVGDLGPKLLAALDALGATPKARASVGKPRPSSAKSRLNAMREGA